MNCKFTEFQRFDNKNSAAIAKNGFLSHFDSGRNLVCLDSIRW
jgi:hypothetical protein